MAMSNWDCLAVNAKGEPINGLFVSKLGVQVEVYKNWLYVRDEKAWTEGGGYVKPTVMQVSSGSLTYKDVHISAKRGPQNGVYAVVTSQRYDRVPKGGCKVCGSKNPPKIQKGKAYRSNQGGYAFHRRDCPVVFDAMIGIGCYAYSGPRFVGVTKTSLAFLKRWLNQSAMTRMNMAGSYGSRRNKKGKWVNFKPKPRWHYSRSYDFEEEIRAIPLDKALRFNQGDAFFARNLKFETPASKPGKGKDTILMSAFKKKRAA